ncbi:hypothetical protein PHLGIDRAFT_345742 [Phlebiopsis gigantea 11061_1 CR5-6]|uniref:Uncharacterized protein n=1 Tax=Phlebiopsis gigantea (strain 11061_1 CR5-6) TaxID=745531 RepID=A0A0C3S1Z4_PHLG1|nr:hypothetical protein PHLGIDRAFT_345742 [Phlebiopsis gigantea 11061_1 CR5-6]
MITPSRLGPGPAPSATLVNGKHPSLSLRTPVNSPRRSPTSRVQTTVRASPYLTRTEVFGRYTAIVGTTLVAHSIGGCRANRLWPLIVSPQGTSLGGRAHAPLDLHCRRGVFSARCSHVE